MNLLHFFGTLFDFSKEKFMKKYNLLLTLFTVLFANWTLNASSHKYLQKQPEQVTAILKHFPKIKEGMIRHVLLLPELSNKEEMNRKVEIFIGKNMMLDCNQHRLEGKVETKYLDGFGYEYYVLETTGFVQSTLMLCPDEKKTKQFVYTPSFTTYYDSKRPLVIYMPNSKRYEIRYKIWKAGTLKILED